MKIVLCEDQIEHQKSMKKFLDEILKKIIDTYEIIVFNSGEELVENYPEYTDIFILDIQMNKISGMDVAKEIRKRDKNRPEIIFTTSVVEYIQEGYEVRAYRYLLKPIKYKDIEKHITSCIKDINEKNKHLIINDKSDIYKINVSKITYIEIQKRDITIHTIDRIYEVKSSMDKIEKELNSYNFYRCHKSFLVNIDHVESIKQYVAILEDKTEVPISRHRFKETKSKFFNSIGDKLC